MTAFKRPIRRKVKIASSVRGFPDAVWFLQLDASGLSAHRKGGSVTVRASWRQLLGALLVYRS